jgi:Rieske Fe-S protein
MSGVTVPDESDKYPEETGRRRFVKGVVGSAALATVGVGSAATLNLSTSPSGRGGGITQFFGIEIVSGPAPNGMPQIPVEIDDEGYLRGVFPEPQTVEQQGRQVQVAETQIGGITYSSEWFQYCGVQTYPGVRPDADQDNYFRYADSAPYQWQNEDVSAGDRMNIDDFEDYETWGNNIGAAGLGKPAMGTWRSQDVPPAGTMPIQVLRVAPDKFEEMQANVSSGQWLEASTQENFVAWLNKCTHFCCVPAFKGTAQSAKFGAANEVYCPCHQSVYDPFNPTEYSFVALPRTEEDGGGGE